jgi:hypothetical protein
MDSEDAAGAATPLRWEKTVLRLAPASGRHRPAVAGSSATLGAQGSRTLDEDWCLRIVPGSPAIATHPQAAPWQHAGVPGSMQTDPDHQAGPIGHRVEHIALAKEA